MELTGLSTARLVERCRSEKPLVQCITNFVSMDLMANTLLAAGASPAMVRWARWGWHRRRGLVAPPPHAFIDANIPSPQAHSIGEAESFVELASALLVNVGTLSEDWVGGMKLAAVAAGRLRKPWVLDPVACGATLARSSVGVPDCDKWSDLSGYRMHLCARVSHCSHRRHHSIRHGTQPGPRPTCWAAPPLPSPAAAL